MHTLLVVFAILLNAAWAGDPCPTKTELRSCTCHQVFVNKDNTSLLAEIKDSESDALATTDVQSKPTLLPVTVGSPNGSLYTVVDCKVPKTITALEEAIVFALHRKAVDKLTVSNVPPMKEHTLARLPSGWLKNTRVKQFEVRDTTLSGDFIWYTYPFEGQAQSLLWLSANKCYLYGALTHDTVGTVNTKGLKELPLVEGVDFSFNQLTIITGSAFRQPPANLSTVILSHNSIQTIESSSLQHIPLLKMVNISHNLLETMTRNIFASPARHLKTIDLSWNSLQSLPGDFFHNMPVLEVVNLSKNFLYALPDKPWASIWQRLITIDLSHNFIACDCNLLWLIHISDHPHVNSTAKPSTAQDIRGKCTLNQMPALFAKQYNLTELTRDKIVC